MNPTGLITFLFTDIEGSTKLSQDFPEKLHTALERHNEILRNAVESNNGRVFKIVGDAFCCAFENAEEAVKTAIEIQIDLADEKWDEVVIKVRIGIHTGNAEWNGEDYQGYITLARVSRILSAAYGEQILVSNDTHELFLNYIEISTQSITNSESDSSSLRGFEAKKISFRDLGERRLKDVKQPVKLYQILFKGLREDFPPLKTLDARPNNLPVQLTSFIGREKEMSEVKDLLKQNSLLTLFGAGGAGKTRFALKIAADVIDEFANGVWIVELASISDPQLLIQTVMNVFDLKEESNKNPLITLNDYLNGKELLIILDNCEHIIAACSELTETLLLKNRSLKIIATSREALRCEGEQIHRILSLKIPDPGVTYSPDSLIQFESVKLFTERAKAVDPTFRLSEDNVLSLAEICFKLDGIPLAIELAATRIKIMSLEKIQERLNDRFNLLTGGKRTALPRQQTLRALIDWSYELLSEEEKILWQRLSVFNDGWTLEAAEEICQDEIKISLGMILDLLIQLEGKSIITYNRDKERYRILETLKQYGEEKLKESGEAEKYFHQHLNYYLKYSESAEKNLEGSEIKNWIERLESEHSNFQAAVRRGSIGNEFEKCARLAGSLGKFWGIRGHYSTGVRLLESINTEDISGNILGKVLFSSGVLNSNLGQYETAGKLLEKSLEIGRDSEDKKSISDCLHGLGNLEFLQGKFEQARVFYEDSLKLKREIKDITGISNSLIGLGSIAFYKGEYEIAKKYFEESLELRRKTGDTTGIAESINGLGGVEFGLGNFESASKYYTECLSLSRKTGKKSGIAYSLYSLGNIEYNRGNYDKVNEFIEEGLGLFREMGDKRGIALSVYCLGQVARNLENFDDAKHFYNESLRLYKEMNDKSGIAFSINAIGTMEYEQGNYDNAQKLYEECLEIRKEIKDKRGISYSLTNIGNTAVAQGDIVKARKLFEESLAFFNEIGEKLGVIDCLLGIAGTMLKSNDMKNSTKLMGAVETALISTGTSLGKVKMNIKDEIFKTLRENLSNHDFEENYEKGKRMTLVDAAAMEITN